MFNILSDYSSPVLQHLFTIVSGVLLGYLAYRFSAAWGSGDTPVVNTLIQWVLGFLVTFAFFPGFWLMPDLNPSWQARILLIVAMLFLATSLLKRYSGKQRRINTASPL